MKKITINTINVNQMEATTSDNQTLNLVKQTNRFKDGEQIFVIDLRTLNGKKQYKSITESTKTPFDIDIDKGSNRSSSTSKDFTFRLDVGKKYLSKDELKTFDNLYNKMLEETKKVWETEQEEKTKEKIDSFTSNLTDEEKKLLIEKLSPKKNTESEKNTK